MLKNVNSQKWTVFAFDVTDNTPKTGDLGQITGSIWVDGAENVIGDANPTELAHGYYEFDLDQAETNGDYLVMDAVSSTENIQVIGCPAAVWTTESMRGTDSAATEAKQDIIDTNVDDIETAVGNLQTQVDTTGVALLAAAVDDIWDEVLTGADHNDATSAGRRLRAAGHDEIIMRENTCQAGEDSTHVKLDSGASGSNGYYDHSWIYLTENTGAGQVRLIDSYVGNTFVAEVHPAWLINPDGTTTFLIMGRGEVFVHDIEAEGLAAIQAELEENGASILDTLNDKLPGAQKG